MAKTAVATVPCPDDETGLGDQIKVKAQELADGWTAKTESIRYGAFHSPTITNILATINNFLAADGKPTWTLDQIDKQGERFAELSASNASFNKAERTFWLTRSTAIGMYVHNGCRDFFFGTPNLQYKTTGPDFILTRNALTPDAKQYFFEVMPETASARSKHANRSMKDYVYRVVYYNRGVINNPTNEDFDETDSGS